ncbi:ferrochelatase [Corynebacterium hadale]|uniref:Coproporphyrin III ferrochelatase n=1 Tax=Corynebacterium hadale TaxID=2026255 RepID=A0ABX4H880_9CORY|nr:ferrochelatase [Corynebacterium hadale]PAT05393.1 ferrochelatase [Corynebacterium hadale]
MKLSDYDALLVLSFGGPEGKDEVIPFLENVTRGRGIPKERLATVGEHYFHFGGVSPINQQNRTLITNINAELERRGIELPVYFGNRNWHPFAEDTAKQLAADGARRVLVFATSAWGGYSACRQYDEDIQRMREVAPEVEFTKLWQFYGNEAFIDQVAAGLKEALAQAQGKDYRVLFTAHSVPTAADVASGGPDNANLYSRQVAEAARLVAERAGAPDYEVVWQSRSGNPATPWLEPDVVDRAEALADANVQHLICVPIGFITDHMEVVWDLDTELQHACDNRGVTLDRVATVGLTQEFASMVVDIAEAVARGEQPASLSTLTVQGCTRNGAPCCEGCCEPQKRPARALNG